MADRVFEDAKVIFSEQKYGHDQSDAYGDVVIQTKDGKRFILRPCSCAEAIRVKEIGAEG